MEAMIRKIDIQNEIKKMVNNSCNYVLDEKAISKQKAIIDEMEKPQINEAINK
jgi:hypothetical protein